MAVGRYLYLNGKVMEESEAAISPFDRGFLWGDGVYEITPCFDQRLYRLGDHLDRMYRSLRYVRIEPGITREEMERVTLELLAANATRLDESSVYKLGHWVTRGIDTPGMAARDAGPATVCIFFRPSDTNAVVRSFQKGAKLSIVATRRVPPQCIETRAKVTSKMNQILAELDAEVSGSLSLMLDINGNVAENSIANFFLVRNGVLWTPPEGNILEGVTRKSVFEIASRLHIPLEERNFTIYDIAMAEEFFITSSAICVMPVRAIDGFYPRTTVPGPITQRLIEAFVEETGFDFLKNASETKT